MTQLKLLGSYRIPKADVQFSASLQNLPGPEVLATYLATSDEVPMVVSLGGPTQVAARGERQFVLGLVGGAVAIASMMALAIMVQGGAR